VADAHQGGKYTLDTNCELLTKLLASDKPFQRPFTKAVKLKIGYGTPSDGTFAKPPKTG
jgi:hypothetical protein